MNQINDFSKYLGENYALNRFADKNEAIKHLKGFDFTKTNNIPNSGGTPFYSNGLNGYVDSSEDHTLIVGSTGSMKTRAVIEPTVVSLGLSGENMVILDPKGEIYDTTSGYLKNLGYKVQVLNFRDLDHSDCYNPLYEPYQLIHNKHDNKSKNKARTLINHLSSCIVESGSNLNASTDSYWPNSAKEYINGLINLLIYNSSHLKMCNLTNLNPLVNACTNEDQLDLFKSYLNRFPDCFSIKSKLVSTIFNANNTKNCIISEAKTFLAPFYLNREIEQVLTNNTINLHDYASDKKMALFVIVPDENTTYNIICSMIIKELYEVVIADAKDYESKTLPRRLNFILDEFANIPKIPNMSSMISAARSRNIRFYLVLQCNSQLEEKYGEKDASTIKNNCQNWIYLNSREPKLINEAISLIGEDPAFPFQHLYLSPNDLLDLKKSFPYVKTLVINKNGKPFVNNLADISLYPIISDGLKIKFKPLEINTMPFNIEYLEVEQLFNSINDLEYYNYLLEIDGLYKAEIVPPFEEIEEEQIKLPF